MYLKILHLDFGHNLMEMKKNKKLLLKKVNRHFGLVFAFFES